jgi:hypothetical protein
MYRFSNSSWPLYAGHPYGLSAQYQISSFSMTGVEPVIQGNGY